MIITIVESKEWCCDGLPADIDTDALFGRYMSKLRSAMELYYPYATRRIGRDLSSKPPIIKVEGATPSERLDEMITIDRIVDIRHDAWEEAYTSVAPASEPARAPTLKMYAPTDLRPTQRIKKL